MTLRDKVADVLETKLPWMRKDLLEFADMIIAQALLGHIPEKEICSCDVENSDTNGVGATNSMQCPVHGKEFKNPQPKVERIERLEVFVDSHDIECFPDNEVLMNKINEIIDDRNIRHINKQEK